MTTPTSPQPTARKETDSSVGSGANHAAGCGGSGALVCGSCPYWHRDDNPGRIEAAYTFINADGHSESSVRVLDSEPCGWCRYKGVGVGMLLLFASHRACAAQK